MLISTLKFESSYWNRCKSALCFGASLIPFAESDLITYDSDVMEADNVDDNDEEEEDDTGHANLRGG